ncbi:TVP38/TMEM64 family protein [Clostridium sp. YIM B02515]|uniref:TVP38/TMEM64 family membrane protein n=1 Tax=Clostridium rhizosphaerae TaxID=2803861 RepID=A0ABS1TBN6_9CLOT|nr:VTT domain-containing protein [Clostridium rhizosphaerae]MBL4936730.1 TVP38/TMEM64 family protein [Clostridium rhizosphaerae]
MKKISKFLVIVVWAGLIYILYRMNLLTGNIDNLNQFFISRGNYKALVFIALSSLRIAALIPSAVFMILGGMMFRPIQGFALTLVSVVLSETIVYLSSKVLVSSGIKNYLINKNPKLYELLLMNNTKILAIGILCPIAPSDAVCFLVSSAKLSYKKFILTIIAANMPMIILYSFLGDSVMSSTNNTIIIAGIIAVISIYSIYLWNKEQRSHRLA